MDGFFFLNRLVHLVCTYGPARLIKTTNQIERLSKDLGAMDSLNRQRIKDISQFVVRETDRQT